MLHSVSEGNTSILQVPLLITNFQGMVVWDLAVKHVSYGHIITCKKTLAIVRLLWVANIHTTLSCWRSPFPGRATDLWQWNNVCRVCTFYCSLSEIIRVGAERASAYMEVDPSSSPIGTGPAGGGTQPAGSNCSWVWWLWWSVSGCVCEEGPSGWSTYTWLGSSCHPDRS